MKVNKYSHRGPGPKGKAHPASVNNGVPFVEVVSGPSNSPASDFEHSASNKKPSGVNNVVDGTAHLRDKVKHMQKPPSTVPGTSRSNHKPSGVKMHSGLKAPKRIK